MVGGGAGPAATGDLTTGVHTSVVDDLADLVSTAVSIVLALHLGAAQGLVGVAHMFGQTLALRSVVDHHTGSVGPTLGSVTGVDTLPVATAVSSTGQTVSTVSVSPALVGVLTASGVGVAYQAAGTETLERARGVRTAGGGMTDLVLALVDVGAAGRRGDEAEAADTGAVLTDLAWPAVLLLVTAGLAGTVDTDLALEAVLVAVTDLGTEAAQTTFTFGTVNIDRALEVTQTSLALVAGLTVFSRTFRWDPDTALLGRGNSSEPLGTGTVHLLVDDVTESIGSTGALLLAGVDTLEVDADLV